MIFLTSIWSLVTNASYDEDPSENSLSAAFASASEQVHNIFQHYLNRYGQYIFITFVQNILIPMLNILHVQYDMKAS